MTDIKSQLKKNLNFKDLKDEDLKLLSENAQYIEFDPEAFIFSAREKANNFYLIISGRVAIQIFSHEKGEIVLEEMGPGELLGWSWLKEPYTWYFDAYSLKKTGLIAFNAEFIRTSMKKNPAFGFKIQEVFMYVIIERLKATRLRLFKELGDNIYIPD
jgi:CRP/FNR family cyclic AMP-dependent transcriptional regulator